MVFFILVEILTCDRWKIKSDHSIIEENARVPGGRTEAKVTDKYLIKRLVRDFA